MMGMALVAVRYVGRVVGSLALLTGACSSPSGVVCPQVEPQYAVQVRFIDPDGDSTIVGAIHGEVREGAYRDSLRVFAFDGQSGLPAQFGGARGRAGTYSLTAKREGYRTVTRNAIQVASGACGVQPAFLNLEMIPEE